MGLVMITESKIKKGCDNGMHLSTCTQGQLGVME